jgi:hypothetical protein
VVLVPGKELSFDVLYWMNRRKGSSHLEERYLAGQLERTGEVIVRIKDLQQNTFERETYDFYI